MQGVCQERVIVRVVRRLSVAESVLIVVMKKKRQMSVIRVHEKEEGGVGCAI
jgi:hypothetical protein